MCEVVDGFIRGYSVSEETELHDKALEMLVLCVQNTDSVTLLVKLMQNTELQKLAFDKLCELGFEKKNPEALNEIVQLTNSSKVKSLAKSNNRSGLVKKMEL